MFQNLANYLLGSVLNPGETDGVETGNPRDSDDRLVVCYEDEDDDNWVLVDRRDSEGNSDGESSSGEDDRSAPTCGRSRTSSSASSLAHAGAGGGMDESWFVTPPPCFTSTGPVHVATSPLENLLIEHPSMSVYHQHGGRRRARSASSSATRVAVTLPEEAEEEEAAAVAGGQALPPRPDRPQVLQQQERQGLKSKRAQKVQIQKACQAIKRGNLERNNKAREVNGRNRRQRRGERSQGATGSRANNNRKCC